MLSPRILIFTTVCNEGPFLLEWIAHHKALGVTDFLIYSNDCTDGTDTLLNTLHNAGEVTHVPQHAKGKSPQWLALKAAAKHPLMTQADWAMGIDCDEFVNLRAPFHHLQDMITATEADAFVLQWRLFGNSNALQFADAPTTEQFTMAAPERCPFPLMTRFFKTLYRVKDGPFRKPGVHRPKSKRIARWHDGSGRPLTTEFSKAENRIIATMGNAPCAWVQLNHYSLRSTEDFMVKRERGLPNRRNKKIDAAYWAERNFNIVEDLTIQRHRDAAKAHEDRLLSMPSVAQARQQCISAHRSAIETILSNPDEATLFTRLALLKTSTPPDEDIAKILLQRLQHASST